MDGSLAIQERRRSPRDSVLRRAQLVIGDALHDCIVLDTSDGGARVRLAAFIPLPDRLQLHFAGGTRREARRCWGRGMELGLQFLAEGEALGRAQAELAWSAYEQLRDGRFDQALRLLRGAAFFDDDSLRRAATGAEAALQHLETVLRARAQSALGSA